MMNHQGKKPILILESHCSQFLAILKCELVAGGISVVQSFDLKSTRALQDECTCPHHGSNKCTCELVVLLLYRAVGGPLTLTLDGHDGQTNVYLNEEPGGVLRVGSIKAVEQVFRRAAELPEMQGRINGVVHEL